MLDYYGSIIKSDLEIDEELIIYFRDYNRDHIVGIINELRKVGTLTLNNSLSGWLIFVKGYIIKDIVKVISEETRVAKRKLEFMKYYESLDQADYHIPELILDKIDYKIMKKG